MYQEKLNKVINQLCHAWEEQQAEHEAKMRSLANSIVAEHETERFNTQKAFKSALAAKNNEINSLLSECKKLKALVTHIHSENKELQKKLATANRTIESLRQGQSHSYDENNFAKKTLSDDPTYHPNEDSLSVGTGDYYGSLDDFSVGSHGTQMTNWNNTQQNRQQSHLFSRERRSPDVGDGYGFNQGGYYPESDHSVRSVGPPSSGGGIGGLFSSAPVAPPPIPPTSSSSNPQFSTRQGPSHGLVYGGRFVLDGTTGDDPVVPVGGGGMFHRDEFRMDRAGSYDISRPDKDSEEFRQHPGFHDDRDSRHIPEMPSAQQNQGHKRLSPSASPFMPGSTPLGQSPIGRGGGGVPIGPPGGVSSPTKSSSVLLKSPDILPQQQPPPLLPATLTTTAGAPAGVGAVSGVVPPPPPTTTQAPPGFATFSSESDQIYSPLESQSSSIDTLPSLNDSSSLVSFPPGIEEDSTPLTLAGNSTSDQTNEAAILLNQMRLQSKSSKLDAKPLPTTQVSPTHSTLNSTDSL